MTKKHEKGSELQKPVPLDYWPDQDRLVWEQATSPIDPFAERGGERVGFRAITNERRPSRR